MALGDLFLTEFEMNVAMQPCSFTLGYEQTGETGDVAFELNSMLNVAVGGEFSSLNFLVSNQATFEAVKTRKLTGDPCPPGVLKLQNVRGVRSGQAIPLTKSCLVRHKQNTVGVRSNGKTYFPGITESDTTEDLITGNEVTNNIQTVFDQLLTVNANIPAGTADWRMVVLRRPQFAGDTWQGYPVVSNSVSAVLFNSARRRTRENGYQIA